MKQLRKHSRLLWLRRRNRRVSLLMLLVVSATQLGGCAAGYYWQAAMGHLELMRGRQPVIEVIADPATPVGVREKLLLGNRAVDFAHATLGLPDNGSYRIYVDTGRPYVVWNVVAAPEFSLEPRAWCFPVAGCVSYRGYFDEARARDYAERLATGGDDVFVGGVAAYSTLGRFADPILNTMTDYADYQLVGLIFHELAHQRLYVKGDSKFNEGFASFVEQAGLRLWFAANGVDDDQCAYRRSMQRRAQVELLLNESRSRLLALYAGDLPEAELRIAKVEVFGQLRHDYGVLRDTWMMPPYFDHWIDDGMNNARLASFATYDDYVSAFEQLFIEAGSDIEEFYARAQVLGKLSAAARTREMERLRASGRIAEPLSDVICVFAPDGS